MKQALIDADILLYRLAFGQKDKSPEDAVAALDETIYRILERVGADYNLFYLTDSGSNFRLQVDSEYKAGRPPKPDHYGVLKDHLVDCWCAEVCVGIEADDALSLENINTDGHNSVIVSIDKDLLQVPGVHYNFVKDEFIEVSEYLGMYNFYTQVLVGDSVDNVKGCKGAGKKKAADLLDKCSTEDEMYDGVRNEYFKAAWKLAEKEMGEDKPSPYDVQVKADLDMYTTARLVWLLAKDRTNLIFERHEPK
jgi:DNA polymerase I